MTPVNPAGRWSRWRALSLAVLAGAVASFMFGGVWYKFLAKPWMAAAGLSEDVVNASQKRGATTYLMALAFVAQLVMAIVLAGLLAPDAGAVEWDPSLAPPLPLLFQDADSMIAAATACTASPNSSGAGPWWTCSWSP